MKAKNILLTAILLIQFLIGSVSAGFISNSVSIKRQDNLSYGNDITINGTNDPFNIRINLIPDATEIAGDYTVILNGLPSNITYNNYELTSDTCTTKIKDITGQDNTFSYTYTPNGVIPCNAIVTLNYTSNNTPDGIYNISYTIHKLSDNTLRTSDTPGTLNINSLLRIIKAETKDTNNNGYIDQFELTFNKDITTNLLAPSFLNINDNSNTASGISFIKTGSITGLINITDSVFDSGSVPNIEITATHNNFEKNIYNLGVLQDSALPQLLTINGVNNSSSLTFNPIPANLVFAFSEALRDIDAFEIQLNGVIIPTTKVLSSDKRTFTVTPSNSFGNASYNTIFPSGITDISGNNLIPANIDLILQSTTTTPPTSGGGGGGSSGGGGGGSSGGGGGVASAKNADDSSSILNKTTKISKIIDLNTEVTGKLGLDTSPVITKANQTIVLRSNKDAISTIDIHPSTNLELEDYTIFYPALMQDERRWLIGGKIKVDNKYMIQGKIGAIYDINSDLASLNTNKDFTAHLIPRRTSSRNEFIIYYSPDRKTEWERFDDKTYLADKETSRITFDTDKFGYYFLIQKRYIDGTYVSNNSGIDFLNLKEKLTTDINHPVVKKLAFQYYNKLAPSNYNYYLQADPQLRKTYKNYSTSLYNVFVNLDKFVISKDKNARKIAIANISGMTKGLKADKNLASKYFTNKVVLGESINSPLDDNLKIKIDILSSVVLKKLQSLKNNETISEESYNNAILTYNNFVIDFILYKKYKTNFAKTKLFENFAKFYNVYKKKVVKKAIVVVPVEIKDTYGDKFTITSILQKGDYNTQVTNLQLILTAEGYFNHAATGYYGDVTQESLKNFAKGEFNLDISGALLDAELREKILKKEQN